MTDRQQMTGLYPVEDCSEEATHYRGRIEGQIERFDLCHCTDTERSVRGPCGSCHRDGVMALAALEVHKFIRRVFI